MFKLWQSIRKEYLLVTRDLGGLIILFVMPIILVTVVTSIQNSTFEGISASKMPILLVDHDQDSISHKITAEIQHSGQFTIIDHIDGKPVNDSLAELHVMKGDFQIAVVLPENLTSNLDLKIQRNVNGILDEIGMGSGIDNYPNVSKSEIKIFFDPATQASFKQAIRSEMDKMIAKLEAESIYAAFRHELGSEDANFFNENLVDFQEITPRKIDLDVLPNAVQHNVPAWTLFAVFFIIVPLSINIVQEKNQGTYLRLRSSPASSMILYAGKFVVYLLICLLQFASILLVAKLIFPLLDLPAFQVTLHHIVLMTVVTLVAGFAAINMSILLGACCTTTEQSAPFGATSVIILAALGGIWIPVYAMSESMQSLSKISPMSWALDAYYDILLRNGSFIDILPEMLSLGIFGLGMMGIAWWYDQTKRTV